MSPKNNKAMTIERLNIITGGVLILFGLFALLWIIPNYIQEIEVENIGLKPSFLPIVSAIALMILSAILMITNFIKMKQTDFTTQEESEENEILGFGFQEIINVVLMILGAGLYLLLMKYSGFIPASIILLGISMYMAGVRGFKLFLLSILFPLAMKELLWRTLQVMLP